MSKRDMQLLADAVQVMDDLVFATIKAEGGIAETARENAMRFMANYESMFRGD